jgi:hypothetical protein
MGKPLPCRRRGCADEHLVPLGRPGAPRAGLHPEHYALQLEAGAWLGLSRREEGIGEVSRAEQAFKIHSQQRALRVARRVQGRQVRYQPPLPFTRQRGPQFWKE